MTWEAKGKLMDEETYQIIQETIFNEGALRNERRANRLRGDTYRRRALALVCKLAELRDYQRASDHLTGLLEARCREITSLLADVRGEVQAAHAQLDRFVDILPMDARSGLARLEDILIMLEKHT
jgi:hypothetical protein